MTGGAQAIRLGVLGCADIAWRKMLPAVIAEPGLQLTAVAGRDPVKTRRFARQFGCEPVHGYDLLLARKDIDAIYVSLPTGLHHQWAQAGLAAGKHVLVEKPLATTEKEAADLISQATARGLALAENAAFMLHGQHRVVQSIVAAGTIGEIRMLSCSFGIPPLDSGNVRYRPELGDGALLDLGFYTLRAAQLFLGPQVRVIGAGLRMGETGVDVAGGALLRAPGGTQGELRFGFEHFYCCQYELWGSEGRLVLDRAFTPPAAHRPVLRIERENQVETRSLPAEDQFAALARMFTRAAAGQADLSTHHNQVITNARLVDAVRACAGWADR